MILLHGIRVSRAGRCIWMLEELGLEYENAPVSFVGDAQKPEYLALNPNGRVPTLVDDDGTVVWESMAINLYLAEKYDRGFRPKSPAERGHVLQWSFWGVTEIEPGLIDAFVHRVMLPDGQRDAKVADAGEAKLARPLPVLDRHLAERPYLLGERFTAADVNVCGVLGIAPLARIDLAKQPNVQRWLRACMARPAAQKAFGAFRG
jgi:glutathione S-transferase